VIIGDFERFDPRDVTSKVFLPYIKGAKGRAWIEPPEDCVSWFNEGLEYLMCFAHKYQGFTSIQNREVYFKKGVAFSTIGSDFTARVHRFPSVLGHMGSSVFPEDAEQACCAMNCSTSKNILQSLNPTIHFEVGDVNRLPLIRIPGSKDI
jgi:hypothetical protein